MTAGSGPAARTLAVEDSYTAINEIYHERGWTDGLPIVPPTEELVAEFLCWTDRDPHDVVGVLAPRQGEATVEKIAINAVMAGCRPEHLPIVLAAVEAVADPAFNLDAVQATTHPVTPLVIVNGPIAREAGVNAGYNAFGQGTRTNLGIGRALRLVLMNIGGGLPGTGDRSTQGTPAKIAYCVAENEGASPWEPLHVELGFPVETSTVTVWGCEGPHNVQDHFSNTGLGILRTVAGAMGQAGSNNLLGGGWPLLSLGPEHAATIAGDGYDKRAVRTFLFEHARFPMGRLGHEYREHLAARHGVPDDAETMLPIAEFPDAIGVIVVGGAGKHSSWQPTFGRNTRPVTRPISRKDGAPALRLADLRR
ncbi:MAG: hypothetical protein HYU51_04270 [Candidatus Rokubacteria bacterium]|nr:hypothetical protein [Candidatus Rokubacteria bacterium]